MQTADRGRGGPRITDAWAGVVNATPPSYRGLRTKLTNVFEASLCLAGGPARAHDAREREVSRTWEVRLT